MHSSDNAYLRFQCRVTLMWGENGKRETVSVIAQSNSDIFTVIAGAVISHVYMEEEDLYETLKRKWIFRHCSEFSGKRLSHKLSQSCLRKQQTSHDPSAHLCLLMIVNPGLFSLLLYPWCDELDDAHFDRWFITRPFLLYLCSVVCSELRADCLLFFLIQ